MGVVRHTTTGRETDHVRAEAAAFEQVQGGGVGFDHADRKGTSRPIGDIDGVQQLHEFTRLSAAPAPNLSTRSACFRLTLSYTHARLLPAA